MKKKVLFLAHWYPSEKNKTAGIFIQKHAEAIALNHEICVIHFDIQYSNAIYDCKLYKKEEADLDTFVIQVYSRFYKYFYYLIPFQFFLFKKLIRKYQIEPEQFDLVHSNVLFPTGILGYKISKKYKLPQFHTEHWSKFSEFLRKDPLRVLGKKALDNCVKISAVSVFFKKEISKSIAEQKVEVIPNIVDYTIFSYQEKTPSQRVRFLAAANWQKPKNPILIYEALEKFKASNSTDFTLTIAGEGPLLEEIKRKQYSFEIDYVGVQTSNELASLFHQTDLFLHASNFETFSVIIVEALATGTPVIVSNVGIANEVITSKNGMVCENKVELWVEAIQHMIKLTFNHQNIAEEIYGKFSYEKAGELFNKFYK
jgi:glycosyltransferase involved in cell wall biosynthesis